MRHGYNEISSMRHWLQNWTAGGSLRSTRGLLAKANRCQTKLLAEAESGPGKLLEAGKRMAGHVL